MMKRSPRPFACLLGAALVAPRPCAAQTAPLAPPAESPAAGAAPGKDAQRSLWREQWPEFSWLEGIVTLAAGAGTAALALAPAATDPRWTGGILFDDGVRDALRADDEATRRTFATLGDVPYYAAPVLPFLVDSLVVSLLVRRDPKTAGNLALVNLEAFSYTGLLTFSALRGVARERPDSTECRRAAADPSECSSDTESFWSGHTAIAATSAGLSCANHLAMPLWGHPIADASACGIAVLGALVTGSSRLVADRHYATDVILGSGIGFGIGFAVPTLLHYSRSKHHDIALVPDPHCRGACLGLRARF